MIESISDFLSLAVTIGFCIAGIVALVDASMKHREENLKRHEELYYRYYDAISDDSSDEDETGLYYED